MLKKIKVNFNNLYKKHIAWILLIFFSIFALHIGCTSKKKIDVHSMAKEASKNQPKIMHLDKKSGINTHAITFRSIFYEYVEKSMKKTDFMRTTLYPDESLYSAPQDSFNSINEHYQKLQPELLFMKSLQNPPRKVRTTRKTKLPTPTLIVIPGAFSEFAFGTIFPEAVDNKDSHFSRFVGLKWRKAESKYKVDSHFLLSELKHVQSPLDELIRFGSIDSHNGDPLINIIFLFPKLGSLESLWTVEEHYTYYKSRLDKFFKIIGNLPRIYISGHSRGAPIALDFIAQTQNDPNAEEWTKNIKGFIGFNGALMGLHFADAWFDPAKRTNIFRREILKIKSLDERNEIFSSIINREKILSSMHAMGVEFAFGSSNRFEPTPLNWPDISAGIHLMREIERQLKPESVLGDYRLYIKRLKVGAEAVDECWKSLSHKVRLEWWKKNTLPPNLAYYTFVSTMHSPINKDGMSPLQKALAESRNFQADSVDFSLWRKIFTEHYASGKVSLLDGPVAAHEGTIWPKWHQSQNPKQPPYTSIPLGIFATHHMGLNYALAAGDDNDEKNPFPRKEFLAALAHFLNIQENK